MYYFIYFQSKFKCPANGILNEKNLKELVQKQLEMEMSSIVRVKSVDKISQPSQKVLSYVRNYKMYLYIIFVIE